MGAIDAFLMKRPARQALQSRNSAQRLFSMQHSAAGRAFAPALDQRQPGVSHFPWPGGNAANPPIEEVRPMLVCNEAFGGGQRTGACFRSETPNPFQPRKMGCTAATRLHEPAPDGPLAGAFNGAGFDRQSAFPAAVAMHSLPVGFEAVDAGRDGFVPVAMRLRIVDDASDASVAQCF